MEYLIGDLPARHGFFTRNGGVSGGFYASLNCNLSGGDDPVCVRQNRALAAAALGLPKDRLLGLKQVHGAGVVHVTAPWAAGAGPDADALFTSQPGLGLGIITADCAPVLLSDAAGTCVGAAHAGWRGALAGVLEAVGMAMRSKGAVDIRAVIGPCIHQKSYEVDTGFMEKVLARDTADRQFFMPGAVAEKFWFDLPGYCVARLARVDIPAVVLPHDTLEEEGRFFSHRRRTLRGEPALGHQISIIRTA